MTVIARFEVIPVGDERMSTAIADALGALERFPVTYETTATDTIIEGDTVDQVFRAVQAAHEAIRNDRVITSLEVDEQRWRSQSADERVESVERALGRPPRRYRERPDEQGDAVGSERGRGRRQSSPTRGGVRNADRERDEGSPTQRPQFDRPRRTRERR